MNITCYIALLQNRSLSLLAACSKSEPVKAAVRQDPKLISVHIDPGNAIPDFSNAPEVLLNIDILFQDISVDLSSVCASFIDHVKTSIKHKTDGGHSTNQADWMFWKLAVLLPSGFGSQINWEFTSFIFGWIEIVLYDIKALFLPCSEVLFFLAVNILPFEFRGKCQHSTVKREVTGHIA